MSPNYFQKFNKWCFVSFFLPIPLVLQIIWDIPNIVSGVDEAVSSHV